MAEAAKKSRNSFQRVIKYFREVKAELKKVVWPTRKQTINNTAVVIISVLIVGIVIWALDAVFGWGLNYLIKR